MATGTSEATCPHCKAPFRYERYHAGFSNEGFLYCDGDSTVLTWDAYDGSYLAVADAHPWMLTPEQQETVEANVRPCPCGGRFSFKNTPLCPHCSEEVALTHQAGSTSSSSGAGWTQRQTICG